MTESLWTNYTFQIRMDRGGHVFELFSPPSVLPVYRSHAYKTSSQASSEANREIQRRKAEWIDQNKSV